MADGAEVRAVKIHIGAGAVYLKGWQNIDVPSQHTFLAEDRPDLVAKWLTTEDNYYGRHKDKTQAKLREGPLQQEYVCDAYGSFDNIPAAYWSVTEVLARHVFEHLSLSEAHKALDQVDGIMKPGGILRLDVPDSHETLELYRRTGDSFYERALFGPRRDDRGYHLMPYTRNLLRTVVEDHGFVFVEEEPNIHFYPAFCLKFKKPGVRAPRDYVELPEMPADWKVLDVGPGEYPLARADAYIDFDKEKLQPLAKQGKRTILGDIQNGLPDIPDKEFDFAWSSHCFEHFENPCAAAATISRIAKRGVMIVPSAWKESLTNFEESGHLWQILPHPNESQPPIFVRKNGQVERIKNLEVQKILSRVFRTGPNRMPEEQRFLRQWWYREEPELDIIHFWDSELRLQVIA